VALYSYSGHAGHSACIRQPHSATPNPGGTCSADRNSYDAALGLQMGLAFAQFIDPARGTQTPLIGSFLGVLASLVFLVIDGHLLVIAAVVQSFELIPVSANMTVVNSQNIAQAGSIMFMLALQISLPVMAAVLISNIVLGILARAAPQLNVMSIGFSITIGVGLWILWVSLPYFIAGIDGAIGRLLSISVLNTS